MRNATILVCLLLLGFLLGMPSPALAFNIAKPEVHQEITKEVLQKYHVDGVDGRFSDYAIDTISRFNADTDADQGNSALHFDNENFSGGSQRLNNLKQQIITEMQKALNSSPMPTPYKIHEKLGTALHTVQDFYAHSNWVELQKQKNNPVLEINKEIGRGQISNVADENTQTCPKDPGTLSGEGLKQLTSGYFNSLFSPCEYPPGIKPGKCLHGWSYRLPSGPCNGINKDNPDRSGYDTARALAVKATEDYLDQILKEPPLKGNVDAAKFLMRIYN